MTDTSRLAATRPGRRGRGAGTPRRNARVGTVALSSYVSLPFPETNA